MFQISKIIDMTDQKIGKLLVKRISGKSKKGRAIWKCLCDCGKTVDVIGRNLRKGITKIGVG